MTDGEPGPATWSIRELHDALNSVIGQAFGETVWVAGELRSLKRSPAGHCYFDLVDPDSAADRFAAKLSVTLFNGYRQRVNAILTRSRSGVTIEEGTTLRICGELKTYEARSQLQLVMTGIDPSFTLGVMQQRRELAMAALAADGLLGLNGRLALPHPPLRLALVTSRGSAAEADVLDELSRSGIGFEVKVLDARVQGAQAEATVADALRTAGSLDVDAVLLVRGGGSRTDLEAFDSELVGRVIAAMPVPVLTGIGHETDRSVADELAHTAFKTPTACAAAIVEDASRALREVLGHSESVGAAARGRLTRAGTELGRLAHSTGVACRGHLGREQAGVEARAHRVAVAAPAVLRRAEGHLGDEVAELGRNARRSLQATAQRVDHLSALTAAHDPALVLARGWSVTRTASGTLVRSVAEVAPGDRIVTTVASGEVHSEVTAPPDTAPPDTAPPDGVPTPHPRPRRDPR